MEQYQIPTTPISRNLLVKVWTVFCLLSVFALFYTLCVELVLTFDREGRVKSFTTSDFNRNKGYLSVDVSIADVDLYQEEDNKILLYLKLRPHGHAILDEKGLLKENIYITTNSFVNPVMQILPGQDSLNSVTSLHYSGSGKKYPFDNYSSNFKINAWVQKANGNKIPIPLKIDFTLKQSEFFLNFKIQEIVDNSENHENNPTMNLSLQMRRMDVLKVLSLIVISTIWVLSIFIALFTCSTLFQKKQTPIHFMDLGVIAGMLVIMYLFRNTLPLIPKTYYCVIDYVSYLWGAFVSSISFLILGYYRVKNYIQKSDFKN